ncbi:MAG: right-handed parallel beta-helix repeat-containing protein [Pirellulaceae bacterium]
MKTRLGLFFLALAMFAWEPAAQAQYGQPYGGGAYGAYGQPGGFRPMAANVNVGLPGRVWFETNFADRGLGYTGSYLTLGGKTQLFEDFLDGRWLGESQVHYSLESGRFFGNLGFNRVFTVQSAGADFSLGGFIDYDEDRQGAFAHSFTQLSLNGSIKTKRWDVIGSGYFPVATTDYAYGDPTGVDCFIDNRIVMQAGIDSALEGFDVVLRTRPNVLAMVNGTFELGGYAYQSELIDQFGGARVGLGFQFMQGLVLNAQVNHDDRFSTTGVLQLAMQYGGTGGRGNEYSMVGRDLEPTIRNDHIVRYQQDIIYAIDPDTGAPYTVWHVDNNADPAFGDGTSQTPYDRLVNAQNASSEGDIIFVHVGDGTTRNYDTGIVLKDDQLFLGDGVEHLIPVQDGRFFRLCNAIDGIRPVITGRNNGEAVRLANNNTVRGFVIDGTVAPGGMSYGIYGDGFFAGSPIDNGIIEDNDISGAVLHGIYVRDLSGDWNLARNDVHDNGFDGVLFEDACDPTSVFNIEDNTFNTNGRDGLHFLNYDAERITLTRNETNGNGRDGVRLENFKNGAGTGIDIDFLSHTSTNNVGNGVTILGGSGNIRFLNSTIENNAEIGLRIVDWLTPTASDYTFIDATSGISSFSGNSTGISIEQNVGFQRVLINDTFLDNNSSRGLYAVASGPAAVLETYFIDNESVSNNLGDGLVFDVREGATHQVVVDNLNDPLGDLPITGNRGNGINFLVGDGSGLVSQMVARVRNVNASGNGVGSGSGVNGLVLAHGFLDLDMSDSTVSVNGSNAFTFNLNNDDTGLVNQIVLRSVDAVDNGAVGLQLDTGDYTLTDMFILSSRFTNLANIQNPTIGTPIPQGGTFGMLITTAGDGADAAVDNRTRLIMRDTEISNFNVDGFNSASFGDSHFLLDMSGNTLSSSGSVFDVDDFAYRHNLVMTTADISVTNARLENNLITDAFERGIILQTTGNSTLNASLIGNAIADNDRGEALPDGIINNINQVEAEFINGAGSQMCLTMSNNSFDWATLFTNNSAPIDFLIELDGATNGFVTGDIGAGFTFPAFGAICEPAISAEETAFLLDGFQNR